MSEQPGLCLDWKNCIVVFFAMSLSKLLCRFCQSNGEDESWYRGHVNDQQEPGQEGDVPGGVEGLHLSHMRSDAHSQLLPQEQGREVR